MANEKVNVKSKKTLKLRNSDKSCLSWQTIAQTYITERMLKFATIIVHLSTSPFSCTVFLHRFWSSIIGCLTDLGLFQPFDKLTAFTLWNNFHISHSEIYIIQHQYRNFKFVITVNMVYNFLIYLLLTWIFQSGFLVDSIQLNLTLKTSNQTISFIWSV